MPTKGWKEVVII